MPGTPRVLIVGYFGFRNAGDEAILRSMVADLRGLRPGIALKVVSGDPVETQATHGVTAIGWQDSRALFAAVADADLIVLGGGGIFHDHFGCDPSLFLTDRQSGIVFYTAPAVLGAMLGKPVVIYAAGVGPLQSGHAKKFTAIACEAATAITVRDDESKRVLQSIGVAARRIVVTADPVFGLRPDARVNPPLHPAGKPLVAVAIRHWDVGIESSFWEEELARGLDRFLDTHGGAIVFVPFSRLSGEREDDVAVSERVFAHMRHRENITISSEAGLNEVIALFGACDLTVGMRLHALMFSALNRVPAVALSYDAKVASFVERIGGEQIIDVKSLDAGALVGAMNDALAGAPEFRKRIPEEMETLARLASKNAEIALACIGAAPRPGWPAPDLSALLIRSLQGQAELVGSLRSELLAVSGALTKIESERDSGRRFLMEENRNLAARLEEALSAVGQLRTVEGNLTHEIGDLRAFQLSQTQSIAALEGGNQALGNELRASLDRQETQIRQLAGAESERSRLLENLASSEARQESAARRLDEQHRLYEALSTQFNELRARHEKTETELNDQRLANRSVTEELSEERRHRERVAAGLTEERQAHAATVEALSRLEDERRSLTQKLHDSVAGTVRVELDLRSARAQIDSLEQALRQSDQALATEKNLRESAGQRLAETAAAAKALDASRQNLLAAIARYRDDFESGLGVLKRQRAWQVMLWIRGAYTLLVRRGRKGWIRFIRWTFGAASALDIGEYDVRFPDIARYIPASSAEPAAVQPQKSDEPLPPAAAEAPAIPKKYDVVIFGIIDFDFRFQRPQQIAAQFARSGHRVFWISPTRFLPPESERPYRVVPLRENLWEIHLRGRQPDIYMGRLEPELAATLSESAEVLFHDWAIAAVVLILQLPFWRQCGLLLREKFGAMLAYDCMDDWETFENMGSFNVTEEKHLAPECDLLIVSGKGIEEKFRARNLSPILVRNGVDFDFFQGTQSTRPLAAIPKPIVGYFGAIADWIDLDLVLQVATARPQYSFVLIGQVFGRDVSALERLPNVYLTGNQPYDLIPAFLEDFDACTIPFLLNQVTKATDPVKLYEYFAKGKPVIATGMEELKQCDDLLYIGESPADFAEKVDRALAEPAATLRARRLEFAKSNTWKRRVDAIDCAAADRFPFVSILIVTCNSAEFVASCLDSIRDCSAYPSYEVIVVDNGSTDETVGILKRYASADPAIRIELLGRNTGFAAANNLAERLSRGEYLILLNIDTIVTSGWVRRLTRHHECDPSIGLICPVTNFAGNEIKIDVSYTSSNQMQHFALSVARQNHAKTMEIAVAPLYCALIPRSVWRKVGELDEQFGIGMFEDDDFSVRVRKAGYRVVAAEDCFVHHFGQGSFSKMQSQEYSALFESNRRHFEQKWKTEWKPHRTRPGVRAAFEEKKFVPAEFVSSASGT